jgi:hypothetical protein
MSGAQTAGRKPERPPPVNDSSAGAGAPASGLTIAVLVAAVVSGIWAAQAWLARSPGDADHTLQRAQTEKVKTVIVIRKQLDEKKTLRTPTWAELNDVYNLSDGQIMQMYADHMAKLGQTSTASFDDLRKIEMPEGSFDVEIEVDR